MTLHCCKNPTTVLSAGLLFPQSAPIGPWWLISRDPLTGSPVFSVKEFQCFTLQVSQLLVCAGGRAEVDWAWVELRAALLGMGPEAI